VITAQASSASSKGVDMATIRLPTPLRPYASGQTEVEVIGGTVSEALDSLFSSHPALRPHLVTSDNQLRPFVNLFLGEDNVNELQGLQTPLQASDRLMLLPSIAGGRHNSPEEQCPA
jgi:molybdopterin converting factor small subunit